MAQPQRLIPLSPEDRAERYRQLAQLSIELMAMKAQHKLEKEAMAEDEQELTTRLRKLLTAIRDEEF